MNVLMHLMTGFLLITTIISCKLKGTPNSKTKSDDASIAESLKQQCTSNPASCLPHVMIASAGMLPCSALYDYPVVSDSGSVSKGNGMVYAFDMKRRQYLSQGRTRIASVKPTDLGDGWREMVSYDMITGIPGFGTQTPPSLVGLPVGLKGQGASGAGLYRPVAYVIKVKSEFLNNADYWVVFKVKQAQEKLLQSYDTILDPVAEDSLRKTEYCEAAFSVPVDTSGKFQNGQPKLNTALDAANMVIDPLINANAKVELARSIALVGMILPGASSALDIQAGCYFEEASCAEAILYAIVDGATMIIPAGLATTEAVDAIKKSKNVLPSIWAMRTVAAANGAAATYDGFQAIKQIQAGNYEVAASYGFGAVFRLGIAGSFEIQARGMSNTTAGAAGAARSGGQANTVAATDSVLGKELKISENIIDPAITGNSEFKEFFSEFSVPKKFVYENELEGEFSAFRKFGADGQITGRFDAMQGKTLTIANSQGGDDFAGKINDFITQNPQIKEALTSGIKESPVGTSSITLNFTPAYRSGLPEEQVTGAFLKVVAFINKLIP